MKVTIPKGSTLDILTQRQTFHMSFYSHKRSSIVSYYIYLSEISLIALSLGGYNFWTDRNFQKWISFPEGAHWTSCPTWRHKFVDINFLHWTYINVQSCKLHLRINIFRAGGGGGGRPPNPPRCLRSHLKDWISSWYVKPCSWFILVIALYV